jgi:REP element-mobilizing transposase RayT
MGSTLTNLLFTESLHDDLYRYIGGIIRGEGGSPIEIGGMPDHIHILARFPARVAASNMLQSIKGGSSKWVNADRGVGVPFAWQGGYAAFSVSPSQISVVRSYIRNQETHRSKLSFKQEYVLLLDKHGIEYDDRYLFD